MVARFELVPLVEKKILLAKREAEHPLRPFGLLGQRQRITAAEKARNNREGEWGGEEKSTATEKKKGKRRSRTPPRLPYAGARRNEIND